MRQDSCSAPIYGHAPFQGSLPGVFALVAFATLIDGMLPGDGSPSSIGYSVFEIHTAHMCR